MRKAVWVLVLAGLAAVSCSPASAEKVTTDPNSPGAQTGRASSNGEADPRLAQPVTYGGGYKRLRDVAGDLEQKTGVRLRCGVNASDWQVRDIPLVVWSKDLPLGKLLRAVADATHTEFTTETVASEKNDAKRSYRIYRTAKTAASIAAKFDAKQAGKVAETQWAWSSLIAFGKSGIEDAEAPRDAVLFAKILAALEPEAGKKLFSGETLILSTDSVPNASQLTELYTYCCKHNRIRSKADPRPEELQRSEIRIGRSDNDDRVGITGLTALCYFNGGEYWFSGLNDQAAKLKGIKGFELAPRPVVPETPKPVDEYPSDRLVMLKTPEDWKLPALATKISLEAPKGKEHPTFSDAMIAIAKASGFSVICEDFETHQKSNYGCIGGDPKFDTRVDSFFVRDTTLGEALKKLEGYRGDWLINERDKLIVGWAHDWRSHHRDLVQEKLVEGIRKKMDGDGTQLDDVTPLANLTDDQIQEWFRNSHAMYRAVWFWGYEDDVSAWRLYESLSADQRKLAKSESGIPLGVFDADALHAFFLQRRKETPHPYADEDARERIRREEENKNALLSDPKVLPRVILRVVESRSLFRRQDGKPGVLIEGPNSEPVYDPTNNPSLRARSYCIQLEGERDGRKLSVRFKGTNDFPIFTPERGKEIADDLRKKAAAIKSQ